MGILHSITRLDKRLAAPLQRKIGGYLSWMDTASYRCASKSITSNVAQPKISAEIKKYLSCMGVPKIPQFLTALKQAGGYLSGGFVIRCLHGVSHKDKNWIGSDLDVYVPIDSPNKKALDEWFAINPKYNSDAKFDVIRHDDDALVSLSQSLNSDTCSLDVKRYTLKSGVKIDRVNITLYRGIDMINFMHNYIDISTGMNLYQPGSLYIGHLDHHLERIFNYRYIRRPIWSRYNTHNWVGETNILATKRIDKYEKRGFKCVKREHRVEYA